MLHLNQKFQGVGHHHEVSSLDLSSHEMTTWRTHKLCSTLFLENRNNVSTGILPLTQASFLNNNPVVAQPTFSNFLNFHFLFSLTAASFEYSACDILQKTGLSILVRHRWQTDFNIWVLHGTLGIKYRPFFPPSSRKSNWVFINNFGYLECQLERTYGEECFRVQILERTLFMMPIVELYSHFGAPLKWLSLFNIGDQASKIATSADVGPTTTTPLFIFWPLNDNFTAWRKKEPNNMRWDFVGSP